MNCLKNNANPIFLGNFFSMSSFLLHTYSPLPRDTFSSFSLLFQNVVTELSLLSLLIYLSSFVLFIKITLTLSSFRLFLIFFKNSSFTKLAPSLQINQSCQIHKLCLSCETTVKLMFRPHLTDDLNLLDF